MREGKIWQLFMSLSKGAGLRGCGSFSSTIINNPINGVDFFRKLVISSYK